MKESRELLVGLISIPGFNALQASVNPIRLPLSTLLGRDWRATTTKDPRPRVRTRELRLPSNETK